MATQLEVAGELVEGFEMFDDWEERYGLLIDLGKKIPPLDDAEKTEDHRIHGCQSKVWVVAGEAEKDGQDVIIFRADSDSAIVKGLVALLYKVYNERTPKEVLSFDINNLLDQLELGQHLSMNRRNGLAGIVTRIRELALKHV